MEATAAVERLKGTRQAAGEKSRARLEWAIGLETAPEPYRVKAAAWWDDHLRIAVGLGGPRLVVLTLSAGSPADEGLATTDHLVLRYYGQGVPDVLARRVSAAINARLKKVTLDRLAAVLLDDPELGREGLPLPPGAGEGRKEGGGGDEAIVEEIPNQAFESLRGTRRAGGAMSLERFSRILGLAEAPEPYRLTALAWFDSRVEFSVGIEDGRELGFSIEARRPGLRGFVSTDKLVVLYKAKDIPDVIVSLMKAHATAGLSPLSMNRLAELLLEDPELGKPGLALPSCEHERPTNQLDSWGEGEAYADFFAGGEMARGQLDSLNLYKFSRNVQHCDLECMIVNPHGIAPIVPLVDYPWENRIREPGVTQSVTASAEDPDYDPDADGMVATDLDEQDVILGNPGKLRQVLEFVTSRPNPGKKPIFVANTCVPTVTGEDVESVVREFRRKSDVPLLYLTVTPKSMNDVLVDLLVERRKRAEAAGLEVVPNAVNLLGFPPSRATRELMELLRRFGVDVNVQLLPDLDPRAIERLPQARLNVIHPNALWKHLYDQVKLDSTLTFIEPPAPFGVEGTRRWLFAILEALGMAEGAEAKWAEVLAELEQPLTELRAEAARHRLGLVVRGDETQYLVDPAHTWGIPVAGVLREAGFGLDVLLHARNPRVEKRVATTIAPVFPEGGPDKVIFFDTFEALREKLAQAECRAVLSHHFYDWRLSEAGKGRFALQHFELGLPGFLRTLERLLGVCRTEFFHRYRKYLARSTEGLRLAALETP